MSRRIMVRAAAALAGAALLTGCGAASPIQTKKLYAASDGAQVQIGEGLRAENLMLLTAAENEPVRVVGSLVNDTNEQAEITLDVAGVEQTYSVEPGGVVDLTTAADVIDGATGVIPGATATVVLTAAGSVSHDIPVLDGTFPAYAPLVP